MIVKMKKIMIILLLIIVVFAVGCEIEDIDDAVPNGQKDSEDNEKIGFSGITKQQCIEANGHWNECGSPCAGTGADFCIEMCQVQCECSGIAGFNCPKGYKCRLSGKIADEMGVCVN
jgi:hypothetical protein|tara:strand:- start:424 stop:774 length:351 start_codon:yes stop_codon:yes gene_type:complete